MTGRQVLARGHEEFSRVLTQDDGVQSGVLNAAHDLQGLGKVHVHQVRAAVEGRVVDDCQPFGQGDAGERAGPVECQGADLLRARGDLELGAGPGRRVEGKALPTLVVQDPVDLLERGIGRVDGDGGQRRIPTQRRVSNGGQARSHVHLGERGVV